MHYLISTLWRKAITFHSYHTDYDYGGLYSYMYLYSYKQILGHSSCKSYIMLQYFICVFFALSHHAPILRRKVFALKTWLHHKMIAPSRLRQGCRSLPKRWFIDDGTNCRRCLTSAEVRERKLLQESMLIFLSSKSAPVENNSRHCL
jgi:hypothetical protein